MKPTPEFLIDEVSQVLLNAAELLRQRGWTKYTYEDENGYCLLGALYRSAVGNDRELVEGLSDPLAKAAMIRLMWAVESKSWGALTLPHWNDAEGRTVDEVIALLEKAAVR